MSDDGDALSEDERFIVNLLRGVEPGDCEPPLDWVDRTVEAAIARFAGEGLEILPDPEPQIVDDAAKIVPLELQSAAARKWKPIAIAAAVAIVGGAGIGLWLSQEPTANEVRYADSSTADPVPEDPMSTPTELQPPTSSTGTIRATTSTDPASPAPENDEIIKAEVLGATEEAVRPASSAPSVTASEVEVQGASPPPAAVEDPFEEPPSSERAEAAPAVEDDLPAVEANGPPLPTDIGCTFLDENEVEWSWTTVPSFVDTYAVDLTGGTRLLLGEQGGLHTNRDGAVAAIVAISDGVDASVEVGPCGDWGGQPPSAALPAVPTNVSCLFHDFARVEGTWTWSETWSWDDDADVVRYEVRFATTDDVVATPANSRNTLTVTGVTGTNNGGPKVIIGINTTGRIERALSTCGSHGGTGWLEPLG